MTPPTIAADVPHRLPDMPVHITTTENRTVHMTTTDLVPETTITARVPETTITARVPETTTTAAAPAPPLVPLPVARIRPSRAEHIAPVAVPPPRVTPVLPAQAVSGARAHAQRMFPPAAALAPPRAAAPAPPPPVHSAADEAAAPAPPRAAALAPPPPVHSAADEAAVAA